VAWAAAVVLARANVLELAFAASELERLLAEVE
jgi:hypothetical protein